jgi:hypothetical protein
VKKLSIALTVAALSGSAFAKGGNGGAIVEDPSRGSLTSNVRAGGNGGNAGSPFDEWDLDRNGVLSNVEALRAGFTEAQFIAMDTDRDGRVTLKEFTVANITPQK